MKSRGKQPNHSDWHPFRRGKGYENYDNIKWKATIEGTNSRYRLVKIEELPFCIHCGKECTFHSTPEPRKHPDLFECKKCALWSTEEDGEIEWKVKEDV